jgi:hypothetical protein
VRFSNDLAKEDDRLPDEPRMIGSTNILRKKRNGMANEGCYFGNCHSRMVIS